jgi:hypothetical protein
MSEIERVLRAVLADVREQRVALEAAVDKIYSGTALREALSVDLREMVIRAQEQHEFFSIREAAGLQIDPATAEVTWEYTQLADPCGIRDLSPEVLHRSRVVRSRPRRRRLGFAARTSKCDCGCPEA